MKKQIMWSSQHLEIDTLSGQLKDPNDIEYEEDDEVENFYDDGYNEGHFGPKGVMQNVMSTPFGLWKVTDIMNPYKQFKLWMGHTNFTINEKVANLIKKTPGVEVLSILTRYRFLVGIGEMFNIRDVRTTIESALDCSSKKNTTNETKHRSKT